MARAAGLVAGLTLASRISGLLRDVVTGYYFGAGPVADAFFVAFRLPNLLRRFVGEGAMNVAFIPVFAEYLADARAAAAERAFRAVATGFTVMLAGVTLIGIVLAPHWLALLAPGFTADPAAMALTVELTRWLFLYLLLICLVALLGGYLNAQHHFLAPALAPILLNLAMIASAVALVRLLSTPIFALVWGALLGGALQLGAQIVPLVRRGVSLRPLWEPRHPAMARVLRLLAPGMLGAAVYQINVMLSTSLASMLRAGSVSALWFAGRIFEFPIGLVAVAIGTAALPTFAEQAVRGAHAEMRRSLGFAVGLINLLAVPASVGLLVLARPITAVLFQHGAFGPDEVERTALALQAYAVGLWPLSIVRVVVPAFYALRDVRTPVLAAVAALAVNALASLTLLGAVAAPAAGFAALIARAATALRLADLGHVGLALAASLATAANVACLVAPLARHLGGLDARPMLGSFGRSLLAAIPMAAVTYAAAAAVDWTAPDGGVRKATWLAATIIAGVLAFAVAALALGGPEVERARRLLAARFKPGN
jgi:putative peptidoglycan lipid II flippase